MLGFVDFFRTPLCIIPKFDAWRLSGDPFSESKKPSGGIHATKATKINVVIRSSGDERPWTQLPLLETVRVGKAATRIARDMSRGVYLRTWPQNAQAALDHRRRLFPSR
jgi:hypothetical protein